MRLIERVAIVTGATGDIGSAVARQLAAEGADLVLVGRRRERLEEVAEAPRSLGPRVLTVVADLTIESEVRAMVARAIEELGRVDVLINAAASPGAEVTLANMSLETWQGTIDGTLTSTMLCTRECLTKSMLLRRSGAIVNLGSTAGEDGVHGKTHFSAAKAGVSRFTEAVAHEVGGHGIRVNCVVPGAVATHRLEQYHRRMSAARGLDYDRIVEETSRATALRRLVLPEEVAAAVAFLASEQASGITGQTIGVTGG